MLCGVLPALDARVTDARNDESLAGGVTSKGDARVSSQGGCAYESAPIQHQHCSGALVFVVLGARACQERRGMKRTSGTLDAPSRSPRLGRQPTHIQIPTPKGLERWYPNVIESRVGGSHTLPACKQHMCQAPQLFLGALRCIRCCA